jgi:HEAT repeat protein
MNRRVKVLTIALFIVFCFPLIGQISAADEASLATLDKVLEKIAADDQGQNRSNLIELEDIIRRSQDSPQLLKQIEKRFIKFLNSNATLVGKQFVCRQLSIIGSDQAVPTLAAMLTQPETSDMARYALERIPGSAVDDALRNALDKTEGKVKVGIINSLGERRDEAAAAPLGKLLSDTDKDVAQAAAASLGKIASPAAAAELGNALKQASGIWRTKLADAYLACADKFAASGDKKAAADIYRQFLTPAESSPIHSAALAGIVAAAPQESTKLVVDAIKSGDTALQPIAISLTKKIPGKEATLVFSAELPNLSPAAQVQLLLALADRKDTAASPAVAVATKSPNQEIRIAALQALGSLGDSSTVALLAQTAATPAAVLRQQDAGGTERQAARESLYTLNSPGVNQAIVEQIPKAEPKVKVELIRSVGQRNIPDAVETILKTADDPDKEVRLESIKVLKDIAQPSYLPKLVDILVNAKSEAELKEAGKLVSVTARSAKNPAAAILKVFDSVKDANVRCALVEILGSIGDANSLSALRTSLSDANATVQTAAVRALSNWPSAAPAADLLKVAKSSSSQTNRTLALRGYVRLVGLDSNRPAEETVKMLSDAFVLAANADEKKLVLSALANVKGIESLNMAASYLDDPALHQEAAAAVIKIAESAIKTNPDQTKAVLQKVIETTKSIPLREKAQQLIKQIK